MAKEEKKKEKKIGLEEQVAEMHEKLKDMQEKNLTLLAEMENLRKRTAKEKEDNIKYRAANFIIDILPTVDMLESALSAKEVSEEVKNWLMGFEMIFNNFNNVLEGEGVEKITPKKGDSFDHNWHQSIEEVESEDVEAGHILEIKLAGYKLKGRLLRPATVVTAKKAGEEKEELLN